uniref:Phosphatidic acid phosphatase type 2/haloperoxidase domain-containing protein n=1 Tax=Spongospora subterranea TaxID=70186 RepID=A0A0H5QHU4_9EUKA|eukprot:CRZ00886.1 hypothetical protein [Spongospora subterranea]
MFAQAFVLIMGLTQVIPVNSIESLRSGYGMPSDHSQFMFFVATYGTLIVMAAERTRFTKASISLGLFITATIVAWSRVHMKVHSVDQIVAGALIGMALALAWHLFIVLLVRPKLFDFLQRSSLGRRLRIRDCAHVHDIVKLEYEAVMSCPGAVSFDDLSRTSETQIEKKIK